MVDNYRAVFCKKKKGGNIYFQAELTPRGQIADWTEGDDKLMHEFMETVKGYNESIMKNMRKLVEIRELDTVVNEYASSKKYRVFSVRSRKRA